MAEENKQTQEKMNTKIAHAEKKIAKDIAKTEEKVAHHEISQKEADKEISKEVAKDIANEIKSESKKHVEVHKKTPKTEAVVNGRSLPISTKHSIALCDFIRNKNIDKMIFELEKAEKKKIAIPMSGEIPHRKGAMMSGRYPVNAIKNFLVLLKSLKANAIVNEMELEKYKIFCKSDVAYRPFKSGGRRAKRTHVTIKLIPIKHTQ